MRKTKTVDVELGKYLVLMATSRFIRILFWLWKFFKQDYHDMPLVIADILHTVFIADFVYIFFKEKRSGNSIIIQ